jgi:hypothetical protein
MYKRSTTTYTILPPASSAAHICRLQTSRTKILGIDNVEKYRFAKFQFKIHSILRYKNDKSDKCSSFENVHRSPHPDPHV